MTELSAITTAKQSQALRKMLEEMGYKDSFRKLHFIGQGNVAIPVNSSIERQFPCSTTEYSCNNLNFLISSSHTLPPNKKVSVISPQNQLVSEIKFYLGQKGVQWSELLQADIPRSWEKHGDLVLLPEHSFSSDLWKDHVTIWQILMKILKCKRLARKRKVSDNDFRSPQVSLLVGDNGWVEHQDNGIRYSYDITTCMFSAGNITEKMRVANFDCDGQTVVDLYAGIGYFTLPYLVHAGAHYVYACEWNPHAVEALNRNLALNKVSERCTVLPGDNREVCPVGVADRVNLGLIPSSRQGWTVACRALKPAGGLLHIHENVSSGLATTDNTDSSDVEHSKQPGFHSCAKSLGKKEQKSFKFQKLSKNVPEWNSWANGVSVEIVARLHDVQGGLWMADVLHIEHVKSYAPHVDHIVLDLHCSPIK